MMREREREREEVRDGDERGGKGETMKEREGKRETTRDREGGESTREIGRERETMI